MRFFSEILAKWPRKGLEILFFAVVTLVALPFGNNIGLSIFSSVIVALAIAAVITCIAINTARNLSLARTGRLASLPGRRNISALIDRARCMRPLSSRLCVLMINLERFKLVNDIIGYDAGDAVLETTATRLWHITQKYEVELAHLGSDEFTIFMDEGRGLCTANQLANEIIQSLNTPIMIAGRAIEVSASIGIAYETADCTASRLICAASIAMSHAKNNGGNRALMFESSMDCDLRHRAELEQDLRAAIANGELVPYYQPILAARSNELVGFESLARWQHPQHGLIEPGQFIAIAEEIDMIGDLCFALLKQACLDARLWPTHLTLSINISPVQLRDTMLPLRLLQCLTAGGLAPGRLIVEITENALFTDVDQAATIIASLRNAGIKVALDDFGTGYSNLHHLRVLQFDRIKIDRSFVQALDGYAGGKIVSAIIGLGHSLGMPITAEGVETHAQADMLAQHGCTYVQGFLYGRPMPIENVMVLIAAKQAAPKQQRMTG